MTAMADAYRQFVAVPIEKRSPALFVLQVSQLLHDRTRGRFDHHIQQSLRLVRPKVPLPASRLMNDAAIAVSVESLKRRGWDIMPWRLDPVSISELRKFAFSTPAYAVDPAKNIPITETSIPHEHGRYTWRMSEIIRVPAVQRLVIDSVLHRLAQDYIGCRPILTSISLWLDPVFDGTYDAHVYHYDNDGPCFLKYFIYLTDVDADTGAHTYIAGSHGRRKPPQFSRARRYDRTDLLGHYGADSEMTFSGAAGMVLAEDTAGFHKGTTLRRGYRLLLQLQYAMLDIPNAEELTRPIDKVEIGGLDSGIKRIGRKFFSQ